MIFPEIVIPPGDTLTLIGGKATWVCARCQQWCVGSDLDAHFEAEHTEEGLRRQLAQAHEALAAAAQTASDAFLLVLTHAEKATARAAELDRTRNDLAFLSEAADGARELIAADRGVGKASIGCTSAEILLGGALRELEAKEADRRAGAAMLRAMVKG